MGRLYTFKIAPDMVGAGLGLLREFLAGRPLGPAEPD
jgi:hypothetical protein